MSEGLRSALWYAGEAQAVAAKQISFMHVGALRRTRDYVADLRCSFESIEMSASYQEVSGPDFILGAVPDCDVLIITDVERAVSVQGEAPPLEALRPRLGDLAAGGVRILMTSRRPVAWFPPSLGSSLLADASGVRCQSLSAEQLEEFGAGFDGRHLARAHEKSGGLAGLLEDFMVVDAIDGSNSAKVREAAALTKGRLDAALAELDHGSLAVLEEVTLRLGQEVLEEGLAPDSTVQALLDSGLCRADLSEGIVQIFAPAWKGEARTALERAISSVSKPPREWTQIASDLFSLERTIRRAVAISLQEEHGENWCSAGLGGKSESVLGLALADGFAASATVDEVANPLDYLLLDDLLDLVIKRSASAPFLGLNTARWLFVKSQIIPIRNRFAHMRIPQPRDAATVRVALRSLRI